MQRVLVGEEFRGENLRGEIVKRKVQIAIDESHLSTEQAVWKKIERQESQETLRQELPLPANIAKMKSLKWRIRYRNNSTHFLSVTNLRPAAND